MESEKASRGRIDWMLTFVPFAAIVTVAALLFAFPESSERVIGRVRTFFGDTLGLFYLVLGLGIFLVSLFFACSKYGTIVLGDPNEKPRYSFFAWGSMMFTCGLAADILFYSFAEWAMYAQNPHVAELGDALEWAGVFPLFHWSFIPWSFYLVLAVAFGFLLHVRKKSRQRFSEACSPILGERHAKGFWGRLIDLFALFALLAGTATTFSVATPLMAGILQRLFHIPLSRTAITILILVLTCAVYTYAALKGFKGIGFLAKLCILLFFGLLVLVPVIGGQARFILESGFQQIGKLIGHFFELATYTDPARTNRFPQDWTVYYWAYWMVWCIAAPFFIGNISKGRTVRQVILGGYGFGVGSTLVSFLVLGNYGLGVQTAGAADFLLQYQNSGDLYELILNIIDTMPASTVVLIVVVLCMIAFYATSFDSIAYTAACYCCRDLKEDEKPNKALTLLWCILLIVLPIALVFSESSMRSIQSISILSAFPIGIIMVLIITGFWKDGKKYLQEKK